MLKIFKKLTMLSLMLLFTFGLSTTAFAATNDDVISALKNAGANDAIITQAENYFKTTTVDSSKLDDVVTQINNVKDLMNSKGVKDATKLSASDKQTVLDDVTKAAEDVGLTAKISTGSDGKREVVLINSEGKTVSVIDGNGNLLAKTSTKNYTFLLAGLLLISAAGLVFITGKRKSIKD